MTDYESPFILPPGERQCSNPGDHSRYELSHENNTGNGLWGRECPVHGPTARKFARSHHNMWFQAREEYATAQADKDRELAYQRMLNYVSESCPPEVPYKDSHLVKTESYYSGFWVMVVACVVACMFVFGAVILAGVL